MISPLVPPDRVPELANLVDSEDKLRVLRRLKQNGGMIMNGDDVDDNDRAILDQFDGTLVDGCLQEEAPSKTYCWIISNSSSRVLDYIEAEIPRLLEEREERDAEERTKRGGWFYITPGGE